jgi:hypothetical protein
VVRGEDVPSPVRLVEAAEHVRHFESRSFQLGSIGAAREALHLRYPSTLPAAVPSRSSGLLARAMCCVLTCV